jgi:hypothetical protein
MNRHIYGLTLFLFIVKIHFLLYWAFFAPISFVSTQVAEVENLVPVVTDSVPVVKTHNCNRRQNVSVELRNLAFDVRNGAVSAYLKINNLKRDYLNDGLQLRLQIFNEEKNLVWDSELQHFRLNYIDSGITVTECSRELMRLNPKKNYYAKVVNLYLTESNREFYVETLDQLTPVLQIKDGIGIGCGYGSGIGN